MESINWNTTNEGVIGMTDDKDMTMTNAIATNDDEDIGESRVTSMDVFDARREGNLDNAYAMAQTLIK